MKATFCKSINYKFRIFFRLNLRLFDVFHQHSHTQKQLLANVAGGSCFVVMEGGIRNNVSGDGATEVFRHLVFQTFGKNFNKALLYR